ncbi:MAG: hypothetical protein FWE40_02310 [Oscillospiraceae bacterium]|jgi:hypothetical protein|nr:hypothetical protein [Oscillospiraceae bacterium]
MKKMFCALLMLSFCSMLFFSCTTFRSEEELLSFDEWQQRWDYYHGIGERLSYEEWQERWDDTQREWEENRLALLDYRCGGINMIEIIEDETAQLILVITNCGYSPIWSYRADMLDTDAWGDMITSDWGEVNIHDLGSFNAEVHLYPILGENPILHRLYPYGEVNEFSLVPVGFEGKFNILFSSQESRVLSIFIGSHLPINIETIERVGDEIPFPNNRIEIPLGIWV